MRPDADRIGASEWSDEVSDEQTWIELSLQGDAGAFGRLVEAYQRPVYNLARRMLGDPLEAEDAAQEAFVRAYTKLHTYRPERKFSTWLLSIASHHCIDRMRRRRFKWLSLDEPLPPQQLKSERWLPEETALRSEERREVRILLDGLPPDYRAPVVLRYWHDLSYEEIAQALGITLGAVKTRLHRARLKMAEQATELRRAQAVLAERSEASAASETAGAEMWVRSSNQAPQHLGLGVP